MYYSSTIPNKHLQPSKYSLNRSHQSISIYFIKQIFPYQHSKQYIIFLISSFDPQLSFILHFASISPIYNLNIQAKSIKSMEIPEITQKQQLTGCPHHAQHHRMHGKYSPSRVQNLFFLNGITSLLGWNVILVSFDYFGNIYTDYNVQLYFPIPVFIGYVLVSISFNFLSQRFSYRNLVFSGILINNLMLVCLLLLSVTCFFLSLFCCFVIGVSNNFAQLSFFAMINYFGEHTVSKFTIGTAGSGLLLTILQMIVAAIFGADTTEIAGFATYIGLTLIYNFWDMYLNNKLFKSTFYRKKILDALQIDQSLATELSSNKNQEEKSYFKWLWETLFVVSPYPVMIMANFIITFLLFPNIAFQVQTSLSPGWKILLLNLMYNLGDFLGKLTGDFRITFNSLSIKYLLCTRLLFFYTIVLLVKSFAQDDILLDNNVFPFFNMFLFAFTNGFVINGSFILSFEKSPNEYKKYAGVLGGIMLQLGIMTGSFLAIPFEMLVNPDVVNS